MLLKLKFFYMYEGDPEFQYMIVGGTYTFPHLKEWFCNRHLVTVLVQNEKTTEYIGMYVRDEEKPEGYYYLTAEEVDNL